VSDAGFDRVDRSGGSESPLSGATILLGVTGGIAAYKAVELCRRLVDAGSHVVPVLTASATRFVGAATFSALASEPAHVAMFDDELPIPHTELGRRADLVIIAPATARLIGSLAAGISSDLLVATLLATRAPVLVCPAMHAEMWDHPAVKENLALLRRRGVHVLEPETGRLAGGETGAGRLPDTDRIVAEAASILSSARGAARVDLPLHGKRVLVTAGGTREPIDPVRYLSNRSSGRQGHALAEVAAELGGDVTLVTASDLPTPTGVSAFRVETAAEMADAVLKHSGGADLVVMAAAVADYRPAAVAARKLRRAEGAPAIRLVPTLDILAELARRRHPGQVLVGFAAETDALAERATAKLAAKGVDMMVANDVTSEGVGFAHETNAVTIFLRDGARIDVPLQSKRAVARAVIRAALPLLSNGAASAATPDVEAPEATQAASPASKARSARGRHRE
jgi:phosphopantothenoylcysteine decarboxylase/phosphopantothenate--cysteine ligase